MFWCLKFVHSLHTKYRSHELPFQRGLQTVLVREACAGRKRSCLQPHQYQKTPPHQFSLLGIPVSHSGRDPFARRLWVCEGRGDTLGVKLGLESCQLDTIEQNHPRDSSRCRDEMLACCLRSTTPPTWKMTVDALHQMEQHQLANRIRTEHPSSFTATSKHLC